MDASALIERVGKIRALAERLDDEQDHVIECVVIPTGPLDLRRDA
jgi:hypothetical protein